MYLPLQTLSAFKVSAVSPDCEMKMHTSSLKTGVSQSKNSEAISIITGNWVSSCIKALVATAEEREGEIDINGPADVREQQRNATNVKCFGGL